MDAIASYTAEKSGTSYRAPAAAPAPAAPPGVAPQADRRTAVPCTRLSANSGGIAGFFRRLFGG